MDPLAQTSELPAGFERVATGNAVLAVRADWRERLAAAGFDVESEPALRRSDLGGRQPLLELELAGRRLLVRRFTHGGLLRWLTGTRFRDPARPFRELADAARLNAAGVTTASIVAARAKRAALFGWKLELVSERLAGARDLAQVWRESDARSRVLLATASGRLVARLHALGFVHADLHPRNLLVDADSLARGAPGIAVIDLDRSRWSKSLSSEERRANLRRLLRYALRDPGVSTRDCARFLRAYQPESAARRADWRAIRADHERARAWHALGRRLETWFAPKSGVHAPRETSSTRG